MNLLKKENLNLSIKNNFNYPFEIQEDGIYFLEIIASAKSWWQNLKSFKSFFNDDDLAVKIDDIEFSKLSGKKGLFDSEAAWNGNNLIEMNNECKNSANKNGKISISWLIGIIIFAVILFFAVYFLFFEKKEFLLPEKYKNYSIVEEDDIDIDNDGKDEKIMTISNIPVEHIFGDTKTIMIKKDGTFLAISEYGSELQWRKIGDFNNNGKIDIATFYGYGGSAGFGKLYLHEWSGKGFDLLLSKEDVENTAELKDLDDDGTEEIVYNFRQIKWGEKQQEIYKWNGYKIELLGNSVSE